MTTTTDARRFAGALKTGAARVAEAWQQVNFYRALLNA